MCLGALCARAEAAISRPLIYRRRHSFNHARAEERFKESAVDVLAMYLSVDRDVVCFAQDGVNRQSLRFTRLMT